MKGEREGGALGPRADNLASLGVHLAFVGAIGGIDLESQVRIFQGCGCYRNVIRSLVNAVKRGFQASIGVLRDMKHQLQFATIGIELAVPVACNVLGAADRSSEEE